MVIHMEELAYSLHLGSDKNRKNISRKNGKNNVSGNTSLSNNAIQNAKQLSKADKHNYRKYDNEQELIEIVRGTSSPFEDVRKLYLNEFEEKTVRHQSLTVFSCAIGNSVGILYCIKKSHRTGFFFA